MYRQIRLMREVEHDSYRSAPDLSHHHLSLPFFFFFFSDSKNRRIIFVEQVDFSNWEDLLVCFFWIYRMLSFLQNSVLNFSLLMRARLNNPGGWMPVISMHARTRSPSRLEMAAGRSRLFSAILIDRPSLDHRSSLCSRSLEFLQIISRKEKSRKFYWINLADKTGREQIYDKKGGGRWSISIRRWAGFRKEFPNWSRVNEAE